MKFNRSFFINTALTITVLTVTSLSVNAKELTKYNEDHSGASHGQLTIALAEDASGKNHIAESSGESFLAKNTTEIEFAFAILVIVVGLIVSEKFQRSQEKDFREVKNNSN